MKTGVKTSEFWMTLVPQIVTVLVVLGVIPNDDVDTITKAIAGVITGVISLVTLVAYIRGRVELKKQQMRIEDTRV